jgi:hypothetical protein
VPVICFFSEWTSFPFDIERIAFNQKQAIGVPRDRVFGTGFYMKCTSGGIQLNAKGQAR